MSDPVYKQMKLVVESLRWPKETELEEYYCKNTESYRFKCSLCHVDSLTATLAASHKVDPLHQQRSRTYVVEMSRMKQVCLRLALLVSQPACDAIAVFRQVRDDTTLTDSVNSGLYQYLMEIEGNETLLQVTVTKIRQSAYSERLVLVALAVWKAPSRGYPQARSSRITGMDELRLVVL